MVSQPTLQLAPSVLVYENGAPPPTTKAGVLALPQIASSAFGDGSHPTTRLCAGAVDFLVRQNPRIRVLDVGTGSGILARIARARGARECAGTDIDEAALEIARENASLDSFAGTIEFKNQAPDSWGPMFDLLVANILEGPLTNLAPAFRGALAPGATLLVSGFTRLQVPLLKNVFQGFTFEREALLNDWAMLMLKREN
jgi:ribosomal protein L11 methyltransferase